MRAVTADPHPATLPRLGVGGSPFGSMFVPVTDAQAAATLAAAFAAGLRHFDTAPFYGLGLGETRVGRFLAQKPRDAFVLSTKVGRVLSPPTDATDFRFDYSYDGILRSHADSLRRLGLDRIDWLLIHDLDPVMHPDPAEFERHFRALVDGGFRALQELRAAGVVRGIGVGLNAAGQLRRFTDHLDLDLALLALTWNLIEQSAGADDLPRCLARGIPVIAGAPFGSGLLTGASDATYRYAAPSAAVRDRLRVVTGLCADHRVPLRAAALQFPLRHPAVTSVLPGMLDPAQVADSLAMLDHPIPTGFWDDLAGLPPTDRPG